MNTGLTGEGTTRAHATRTGVTVTAVIGADTTATDTIGNGRMGAVTTGMANGAAGVTGAVKALGVITGAGITPRPMCTLPMSICRASTCTSCFRCSVGREIVRQTAIWSVPHAHRSVFYRGRIR